MKPIIAARSKPVCAASVSIGVDAWIRNLEGKMSPGEFADQCFSMHGCLVRASADQKA